MAFPIPFAFRLTSAVLFGFVAVTLASDTLLKRDIPGIQECIVKCPQDCGMTKDERGCSICHCGNNPFPKSPPPPAPGTGKEECLRECPQDCGMTRDPRGCAICDCSVNPFFKPPPPSPPGRKTRQCQRTCPQDCGMTRDYNGCAICNCNVGPYFNRPPPYRPGGGRACSLALPLCRPPCRLLYDQQCPRCSC